MRNIHHLLNEFAEAEDAFRKTTFLAPCVRGGQVRTKVAGIIVTFAPKPRNFEGWGIFKPVNEKTAEAVEEAGLPQVMEYLRLFKPLRLRLAYALQGRTWLAYPVNESDARQRLGEAKPVPVHLVSEGLQFEQMVARWDGGALWFDEADRRADPQVVERLRDALRAAMKPEEVRFKGITPEMRAVYDLAYQQTEEYRAILTKRQEEKRLREALQMGGGTLREYHDRGDFWLVEWTTRDGHRHTSAISKRDLTVLSAGICLHNEREFDLQSLVGVVERQ